MKWQLAWDEYGPQNPLALAATGFLGAGVFPSQITANEVESSRYDAMDDMLGTTASGMLGLTLSCARCHDHKFDPLPTRDYYAMLSTFTTTTRMNVDVHPDGEVTSAVTTMNAKKNTPAVQGATRMMICAEGYDPIVMHTQGGPFFDKTYVLKRGNPLMKDGEATQGFLQVLSKPGDAKRWQWQPPAGAKSTGKRRSLPNPPKKQPNSRPGRVAPLVPLGHRQPRPRRHHHERLHPRPPPLPRRALPRPGRQLCHRTRLPPHGLRRLGDHPLRLFRP